MQAVRPLRGLVCFSFDVVPHPMLAMDAVFRTDFHVIMLLAPLLPPHVPVLLRKARPHAYLISLASSATASSAWQDEGQQQLFHAHLGWPLTARSLCQSLIGSLPHLWPHFVNPQPDNPSISLMAPIREALRLQAKRSMLPQPYMAPPQQPPVIRPGGPLSFRPIAPHPAMARGNGQPTAVTTHPPSGGGPS